MGRTTTVVTIVALLFLLVDNGISQTNETAKPTLRPSAAPATDQPTSVTPNDVVDMIESNLPGNNTKGDANAENTIVLDEAFFKITYTSLELEIFLELGREPRNITEFEYIKEYNSKVDKSIVAKKDGKCFAVFRGSVGILDALANFLPGFWPICPNGVKHCKCLARKGFFTGYNTDTRAQRDADIKTCVDSCTDKSFDTCLVVSGHSRGGSIAHVATVALQEYNPLTITSGHGRSLSRRHCSDYLNPNRMIRLANSRHGDIHGMAYDRWVFFHQIDTLMWNHGITYILSDDVNNLANIGVNGWEAGFLADDTAHALTRPEDDQGGYRNRIERIMAAGMYPVNTNGFQSGFFCSRDIECISRRCRRQNFWHHFVKKCE